MYGKQKASNPAKDFDINDIDDLLNSTMKDVDEDLDMNDPELLVGQSQQGEQNIGTYVGP